MSIFCSKEKSIERYNICKACEHFRKSLKQCKLCYCFMPVKTRISAMTCPINKWGNPFNSWSKEKQND